MAIVEGTRFDWTLRNSLENRVEELQTRVKRKLTKDSRLSCLVCGKRPRENDMTYSPAKGTSSSNKVIGHMSCVDNMCDKIRADRAAGQPKKAPARPSVVPFAEPTIHAPAAPVAPVMTVEDNPAWQRGWISGVRFLLEGVTPIPEMNQGWSQGFADGILFASAHRKIC